MQKDNGAVGLNSRPIGIFDSGIGGLTVARAVAAHLPHERLIYFGDTAHLPYGEKSTAAIQAYSIKICDMLLGQKVKAILIACNTASAAAFELIKEYVGSKAVVMNVIDPMIAHVANNYANTKVGLIGTKLTVASNVYLKKIDAMQVGITLASVATPLLAAMIEEGFFNNGISHNVIEEYLSHGDLDGISALILGCTHYPLIAAEVASHLKEGVSVLDSSAIVAQALGGLLASKGLLSTHNEHNNPTPSFFVSDYTHSFAHSAKMFFGTDVVLEQYPLWE